MVESPLDINGLKKLCLRVHIIDKMGYLEYFSYFSMKTYVVGTTTCFWLRNNKKTFNIF